ncbi:MAG: hypothetical protein ACYC7A_08735 [Thermoanaerobaculia bacterium]
MNLLENGAATSGDGAFWSTGPAGEFRRHGSLGLYYSESSASSVAASEIKRKDRSAFDLRAFRPWMLVLIGLGALLVLLGLLVVIRKGPAGWVEVVLGAAMVATPFVMTAKQRRDARAAAERERLARAEEEERRKRTAGEFAAQVERLHADVTVGELETLRATREQREIPLEAYAHLAEAVILRIGFDLLVERGLPPGDVSNRVIRIGEVLGLPDAQIAALRTQIYQKIVWQLLADRRLTPQHHARLDEVRRGLGVEGAADLESSAIAQFEKIDALDPATLPKLHDVAARPSERAVHQTPATIVNGKGAESGSLLITSRRVALRGKKEIDIPVEFIYDVEVDADRNLLRIVERDRKEKTYDIVVPDPIYTAALVQIAAAMPRKPAGLV